MRNWQNIDRYLNVLAGDIYPQISGHDEHAGLAYKAIDLWMSRMTTCTSVLDLGCGDGFAQEFFEGVWNVKYEGVTLGEDILVAKKNNRNVKKMDFHFLEYEDKSFDLLFARHSLEHSPMPILALMEWERVSKYWLGLILPHPDWYTYKGVNHYSVMNHEQIENLIERAGWKILWDDIDYRPKEDKKTSENPDGLFPHEFWLMLEKKNI